MQNDLFGGGKTTTQTEKYETYDGNKTTYKTILTEAGLMGLRESLRGVEKVAFDTETTGVNSMTADLVGVSLSVSGYQGWYIAVNSRYLTLSKIVKYLRPILEDPDRLKIAHNFKYDYQILKRHGIHLTGKLFDTMVAGYLLDNSQRLKMDTMAKKYLGYDPISIDNLLTGNRTMADVPIDEVSTYACEDTDITYRLYEKLRPMLIADGLAPLAAKIEFPCIYPVSDMEMNGIKLDVPFLTDFSAELVDKISTAEHAMYDKVGYEFNPRSPQQVGEALYKKLNYPIVERTKTGNPGTGESVLKKLQLRDGHEDGLPGLILNYRKLEKLRGTYVDALPGKVLSQTGRLHTSFNMTITDTGRLSSSNPNLQNIPARWKLGNRVREAFVAPEGYTLLGADYSQMELRIIAAISKDPIMLDIFNSDGDIHQELADEIGESRDTAKTINYAIPYGAGAPKIASELGISTQAAQNILDRVFARFSGYEWFINTQTAFAKKHGFVKTLYGRRRYLPDIKSKNKYKRFAAERQAVNMPIQGTSADIMKLALINVHNWIRESGVDAKLLLQIHDEMILEVPETGYEHIESKVVEIMRTSADIGVDLKVDSGVGDNWAVGH